jgi:hypothetical protein
MQPANESQVVSAQNYSLLIFLPRLPPNNNREITH